jgi:hypothetical protein
MTVTTSFSQTLLVAPPEYRDLHSAVVSRLTPDRLPLLIGIDGRDGSSKSSCGSWLAWQLGMPCIHLDQYVLPDFEGWRVDLHHVVVASRLARNRPVIVEGCLLLKALAVIDHKPDFLVFVENTAYEGSLSLHNHIEAYLGEMKPR